MNTISIPVKFVSMALMEEAGWELSDDGRQEQEFFAKFDKSGLIAFLTPRQRQVLSCLIKGMERKETARHLMISLQAIHQIIPRMRKRLQERAGIVWRK